MTIIDNNTVILYLKKLEDIKKKLEQLPNSKQKNCLKKTIENIKQIEKEYPNYIKNSLTDEFRYIDYFSYDFKAEELIEYFNENYTNEDIEEKIIDFAMFSFIKYIDEIIGIYEEFELSELCYLVDVNNFYEKLIYLSSFLVEPLEKSKWNSKNKEIELPFLNDTKYQIFFTGLSFNDIKKLETTVIIQLINKLTTPLATETVIPKAEGIEHVKDLYDFPIQRIQFADDYRIAFIRIETVTVILGVNLKTGKDLDYSRYDSVAKKAKQIYEETYEFINKKTPQDSEHYKTMEILHKKYLKKGKTK